MSSVLEKLTSDDLSVTEADRIGCQNLKTCDGDQPK